MTMVIKWAGIGMIRKRKRNKKMREIIIITIIMGIIILVSSKTSRDMLK